MLRRRQINSEPSARWLRSALSAAAAPLRRVTWAAEERLRSGGALLAGVADAARWPFEQLAWTVERRLVWPLRERAAGWGPPVGPSSPRRRAAAGAALGVAAGTAVVVGLLLLSGGNGKSEAERVAAPTRVAIAPPPAKPAAKKQRGPALRGATPSFGLGKGVGVAKGASGNSGDATATDSAATDSATARASTAEGGEAGASGTAEGGGATASSAKPAPAGPAAMKVARRFAEAFVFYEVGKRPAHAKAVFGETATPQLAEALAERPPRLPTDVTVPKARVVNLVPGPRRGRAYTVSVSLLRLGLTSELRVSLRHDKSEGWRVSEILG
jgi:hypothetical protein